MRPVHEQPYSTLLLDRDPVRWTGSREHGLGWVEADARRPSPRLTDWSVAAGEGICGLVLSGRRRFLHSAVNGLAPLYWLEEGGVIYFSSRIDSLVRSSASRLSVDWDAWAAIVTLRYPLADRTPFAEIKRLPPSSTLRRRFGGAKVDERRWPWAEVEPGAGLATAAENVTAALEEALDPLPAQIVCPLSGGRDSRMLFLSLAREGRVAAAVTVADDEGDTHEEDLAGPVAAAFGVEHERLRGAEADYPRDWDERARRVEYEFVDHAWLVPVADRVAGIATPVPDGFAIDAFLSVGRHFYTPEVLGKRGRASNEELFETLRRYGLAHLALEESFHGPLVERSREQFLAATKRFEGHPSQSFLSFYATRSARGVSTYATKLIGERASVVTPGATDAFVRAALSAPASEKTDGALYREVFRLLAPRHADLPSTAEAPRRKPHLPRRWCSAAALSAHRRLLSDGPLATHLSPELRGWLEGPSGVEPSAHLRLGMEAVSLLHAWWRRYRDFLKPVDPANLRG